MGELRVFKNNVSRVREGWYHLKKKCFLWFCSWRIWLRCGLLRVQTGGLTVSSDQRLLMTCTAEESRMKLGITLFTKEDQAGLTASIEVPLKSYFDLL